MTPCVKFLLFSFVMIGIFFIPIFSHFLYPYFDLFPDLTEIDILFESSF